jgi:hypothetical protein
VAEFQEEVLKPVHECLLQVAFRHFYIDLLFFNWAQSRFVVVELKVGQFSPEHLGQLGFYVSWVDANLRDHDRHSPTVGILLCAGRNDNVVRYSLAGTSQPLAVADYTYDSLPAALQDLMPSATQLAAAADTALKHIADLNHAESAPPHSTPTTNPPQSPVIGEDS